MGRNAGPATTRLTTRLPVAMADRLGRVAELQGVTVNAVITAAVESYLNPVLVDLLDHHTTTEGTK